MKRNFLILGLIFACAPLRAELAGRVRLEAHSFFQKQKDPVSSQEGALGLEIEAKQKITRHWRWRLEPKVRVTTAAQTTEQEFDGDLRDSGLEAKYGNLQIQIGSVIRNWEGTDGLNPMDLATMKNLRDPLASESIGSPGLALSGGENFFTWDLLFVPRQVPSRLPGERAAWWPRSDNLPLEKEHQKLLVPDEPRYELLGREELDGALNNNGGLRIQFHGDGWDFALAGFEGAAQTPLLQPTITGDLIQTAPDLIIQMKNPIRIRPYDYRRRSYAGLITWNHESWIVRMAARHDEPLGEGIVQTSAGPVSLLPTWSDQAILGLEKTVSLSEQSVIFSLQATYGQHPESGGVLSAQDLFERAVLYGFRWPTSDVTTWMFAGMTDTIKNAGFHRLAWQRKISDPWSVEISVRHFRGPPETLLGAWSNLNDATITTLYQF